MASCSFGRGTCPLLTFASSAPLFRVVSAPPHLTTMTKAVFTASWLTSSFSWSTLATSPCTIICCSTSPLYNPAHALHLLFSKYKEHTNFPDLWKARTHKVISFICTGLVFWLSHQVTSGPPFCSIQQPADSRQLPWWTPCPGVHGKEMSELCWVLHWSYSPSGYLSPVLLYLELKPGFD